MAYPVVKTVEHNPSTAFTIDDADTLEDAILLARLYASEHAARIMLDNETLRDTADGAVFTTNNGTHVAYQGVTDDTNAKDSR